MSIENLKTKKKAKLKTKSKSFEQLKNVDINKN